MKVRSIAVGFDAAWPLPLDAIARAGRFLRAAVDRFEGAGIAVQTTRLVLSPFAC